jgi:hypothetical protein
MEVHPHRIGPVRVCHVNARVPLSVVHESNAPHPSQRNHCHIRQNFPPLVVTGLAESARTDMSPAMLKFLVREVPTQPTNGKCHACPIRLSSPKQLIHNDYKLKNTIPIVTVLYDSKRSRRCSRKTPNFY